MKTLVEYWKSQKEIVTGFCYRVIHTVKTLRRCINSFFPKSLNPLISFGRLPDDTAGNILVFFPCSITVLSCGLTGIVSYRGTRPPGAGIDLSVLNRMADKVEAGRFSVQKRNGGPLDEDAYLSGKPHIDAIFNCVQELKCRSSFHEIFTCENCQRELAFFAEHLQTIITEESKLLADQMGRLAAHEVDLMSRRIEDLKDIAWAVTTEILDNVTKIKALFQDSSPDPSPGAVQIVQNINAVLNSIDRLEVRGRDSSGTSLLFLLERDAFDSFMETLENIDLKTSFEERNNDDVMVNGSIGINRTDDRLR